MKVFRPHFSVLLAVTAAGALLAGNAAAADLNVQIDQGRLLTFRSPVKTVFVGNPLIADVTVVDDTHVFLTGKNFGSTNLVVLSAEGAQIANEKINVFGATSNMVTVQRGGARTNYTCADGRCQQVPVPGDAQEPYENVSSQIMAREQAVRAAATGEMPEAQGEDN